MSAQEPPKAEATRALDEALDEAGKGLASLLIAALDEPERSVEASLPHPFSNMTREEWIETINLWRQESKKLLADLPGRPCPACGGEDARVIFESYDAYDYAECCACGSWYVPKKVDGALFQKYFDIVPAARRFGDYTQAQDLVEAAIAADRQRFDLYYGELARLLSDRSQPLTALDVGCGVGNSLVVARERGFSAFGLEVNESAVRVARERGLEVSFPGEPLRREQFDAVTFWETLEHLQDPLTALQDAEQRLAPGGVLAISVPNLNSPAVRSMRGDSMQIHGGPAWPGHINLFTPQTLDLLLRRAGLKRIDAVGQYTMNVAEVAGFNLGAWPGAFGYRSARDPVVRLPAMTARMASRFEPIIAAWEELFCFAPILRVVAIRESDAPPAGLQQLQAQRRKRVVDQLASTYAIKVAGRPFTRGETLSFDADYADAGLSRAGDRARFSGRTPGPYDYVWKSAPIALSSGDAVSLRGRLYAGGVTFGALKDNSWIASANRASPGAFELTIEIAEPGAFELVIANHQQPDETTDADFDQLARLAARS